MRPEMTHLTQAVRRFEKHSTSSGSAVGTYLRNRRKRAAPLASNHNSDRSRTAQGDLRFLTSKPSRASASYSGPGKTVPKWHRDFCKWNEEIAASWSDWKCHCGAKAQTHLPLSLSKSKLMRQAPGEGTYSTRRDSDWCKCCIPSHARNYPPFRKDSDQDSSSLYEGNELERKHRQERYSPQAALCLHSEWMRLSLVRNAHWDKKIKTFRLLMLCVVSHLSSIAFVQFLKYQFLKCLPPLQFSRNYFKMSPVSNNTYFRYKQIFTARYYQQ